MLGGVGVDDVETDLDVVDEDDGGLAPGERLADALGVLGRGDPSRDGGLHGLGEVGAVGDEDGGGQGVVLGLADEVGGDVLGVGGRVGEDRDLGGAGLGVDADESLEQPLGGGDPDVAGTGDEVDRVEVLVAVEPVREGRDGLGAAHRPHLVDLEQRARGEDRRVRPAAVVLLGRARHGERPDAGEQGRDDVHDDTARVDGTAAGDVEADPVDGHPALGHGAAGGDRGGRVGAALLGVDDAGAADGLLQRGPDLRVEDVEGGGDDVGGHAQRRRADAVEALGRVEHGRGAAGGDVVAHGADGGQRCLDVELGTGQASP